MENVQYAQINIFTMLLLDLVLHVQTDKLLIQNKILVISVQRELLQKTMMENVMLAHHKLKLTIMTYKNV